VTKETDKKTHSIIADAVEAGLQAGRRQAATTAKDAYKATEKRLYALPILEEKIADDRERLQEMLDHGLRERSKSLVRFQRSGSRISPEEMLEAIIKDLRATIAADEYETQTVRRALAKIENDAYYRAVTGKYIDQITDEEIAEDIPCDPSTVWRNRKRLVQRIAVFLYGSDAL